jgi:thiol:disulfide interchange protein DsbD
LAIINIKKIFILLYFIPYFGISAEIEKEFNLNIHHDLNNNEISLLFDLKIPRGWHIYWENPGQFGIPTIFEFKNKIFSKGKTYYLKPTSFYTGEYVSYGFKNKTMFLFKSKYENNVKSINGKINWLACKEICIPGSTSFSYKVTEKISPDFNQYYNNFEKAAIFDENKVTTQHIINNDLFYIELPNGFDFDNDFNIAPLEPKKYIDKNVLKIKKIDSNKYIVIPKKYYLGDIFSAVILSKSGSIFFESKLVLTKLAQDNKKSFRSILVVIFLSFLGGITLNFMPCVLPVVALKFRQLALLNKESKFFDSLSYFLGIISFTTLIGVLINFLSYSGNKLGWGFQFQSPNYVLFLIFLFLLIGLNLVGFNYKSLHKVSTFGNFFNINTKNYFLKSYISGALLVLIASPCTGPFMGSALGFSLSQPFFITLLIFFFLGFGLGLPIFIFSIFFKSKKFFNFKGKSLSLFQEFLAIPIFATVVWLLWVLSKMVGADLIFVILLLVLLFTFFLFKIQTNESKLFYLMLLIIIISIVSLINSSKPNEPYSKWMTWREFQPQNINQFVFVDYTAAWCITCQINKGTVLSSVKFNRFLDKNEIKKIRADWTNSDPSITRELNKIDRNGVPTYVLYGPNDFYFIFPEILTEKNTINAIRKIINNNG